MHFSNQRTSRIKDTEATRRSLIAYRFRHAMRTENQGGTGRHIGQRFDKDGTACTQAFHHKLVMDDFVTHINRRTELFQCPLDNSNCALHPGAETTRIGQNNRHRFGCNAHSNPIICTSKRRLLPANGWLKSISACVASISRTKPANSAPSGDVNSINVFSCRS